MKSFSQYIAEAEQKLHPQALHVSYAGGGKYKVHAVGNQLSSGIKVGEHLNDTELDDATDMGAKIKHLKPPKPTPKAIPGHSVFGRAHND